MDRYIVVMLGGATGSFVRYIFGTAIMNRLGIPGYGAKRHIHKKSCFHVAHDLPIMISVVEPPEKLSTAAEVIEQALQDGLIIISGLDVVRLVHSTPNEEQANATISSR